MTGSSVLGGLGLNLGWNHGGSQSRLDILSRSLSLLVDAVKSAHQHGIVLIDRHIVMDVHGALIH